MSVLDPATWKRELREVHDAMRKQKERRRKARRQKAVEVAAYESAIEAIRHVERTGQKAVYMMPPREGVPSAYIYWRGETNAIHSTYAEGRDISRLAFS